MSSQQDPTFINFQRHKAEMWNTVQVNIRIRGCYRGEYWESIVREFLGSKNCQSM